MPDLVIRINGDAKQFTAELEKIEKQTEDLSGQLGTLAQVATVAFAALVAEATLAIRAFAESEKASNDLSLALANNGLASKKLADNYKNQAKELQKLTGVDDDAIVSGQALLQNMIGQTQISKEMSAAAVDLGAKLGDTSQGFEVLGQAINGRTKGLKSLGIEIDENLTREQRTIQILQKVTQAYGGTAEAANKGLGSIKGLQTAFGNFQEGIGERLAPAVTMIYGKLTQFFNLLSENKAVMDLVVSIGVAAATVTGLIAAFAAGTLAFLKFQAVIQALGVTARISTIAVKGLVGATGIGLLIIVLTELALNWDKIWPKMRAAFTAFVNNISALGSGLGKLLMGVFTFSPDKFKKGLAEIKEAFAKGIKDFQDEDAKNKKKLEDAEKAHQGKMTAEQKAAAAKRKADQQAEDDRKMAQNQARINLTLAQEANASTQLIELRKQEYDLRSQLVNAKNEEERAALQTQIDEISRMEMEATQQEQIRRETFKAEVLAGNAEYNALTLEEQQLFLDQHQSQLLTQIETEKSIRQQLALDRAQLQIQSNNQYLKEQIKFGTAYAMINKIMHSEVYQGSKQAFGELAQLQTSSNSTLKGIGKAAAIANIIMKTSESAMNIYAGFSTIPIVGPVLGIAGAAAAVAFGAEQIGKVTSAAQGGLMTGGIPGVDSIPTLTMPGELVVPTRNYEEVVSAVADQRAAAGRGGSFSGSVEGGMSLTVNYESDEAEKLITVKQTEAKALGTFRGLA